MFTGIVEEIGHVVAMEEVQDMKLWDGSVGKGWTLSVRMAKGLEDAYIGCSIAINGVCLTAIEINNVTGTVAFGVSLETLRRSNLKDLSEGDRVNVERGMSAQDRNSGHFVQGHVDGTGSIQSFVPEGDSVWVRISTPASILQHIVPKGFIAIDGTSLTVCDVDYVQGWFNVMLVKHTQAQITLPSKSVGSSVNLETDVLGKYASNATQGLTAHLHKLETQQKVLFGLLLASTLTLLWRK